MGLRIAGAVAALVCLVLITVFWPVGQKGNVDKKVSTAEGETAPEAGSSTAAQREAGSGTSSTDRTRLATRPGFAPALDDPALLNRISQRKSGRIVESGSGTRPRPRLVEAGSGLRGVRFPIVEAGSGIRGVRVPVVEAGSAVQRGVAPAIPRRGVPIAPPIDAPAGARPDAIATSLRGQPVYRHAARSVAISPDGRQVAVGDGKGQIQLWNVTDRTLVRTIKAHTDWTFDLTYAPDGTLVSGGGDNLVKLFDTASGNVVRTIEQHSNDLHGVAITPDGEWLISAGDDTTVVARSLVTDEMKTMGRHTAQVTSVAISPDGKLAASASRDRSIRIWDLKTFTQVHLLRGHGADVMSVAFSRDGSTVVSGGYDGVVHLWTVGGAKPYSLSARHSYGQSWVFATIFDRTGRFVFIGGAEGLKVFERDARRLRIIPVDGDIADLSLSTDGTLLAAATSKGAVLLFRLNPETAEVIEQLELSKGLADPESPVTSLLSPADYIRLHRALLVEGDSWDNSVAAVAPFADPYTASLLTAMADARLPPEQREMKTRVLEQLATRRGEFASSLKPAELEPMLLVTAMSDAQDNELKATLVPWMKQELRKAAADPVRRKQLEALEARTADDGNQDKQPWGTSSKQIREYLLSALKT